MSDSKLPNAEPWTIGRLLTWTADYLRKQGSDSPRLDAEILLAHARGCQRIELYTAFDAEPSEEEKTAFREMVRRRAEHTPVAYLTGYKEFYSLNFRVSPDVLIPRPETELIVVTLLDKAQALSEQAIRIVDVGTGSGILAVCAARHLASAEVTAIDVSPAALAIAGKNAEAHQVSKQITFIEGDLLSTLPIEPALDFIISNPPYVTDAEFDALAADVREHEPRLALTAGPQGTEIIERLIPQAADRLAPGGWLIMELSPMIAEAAQQLVEAEARFHSSQIVKDLDRQARVITAQRR